jgi:hypothetical protein
MYVKTLLTKIQEDGGQITTIVDYAKSVLEQSSEFPSDSIKSILNSIYRLDKINFNNIFTYKSVAEINEKMCSHLNVLKNKSTQSFKPFVSYSTKSLCHSMGNPLKAAEDLIEYKNKNDILNSLLKIVTLLSYRFASAASTAALLGECRYPELSSFVFDEENSSASYRKEISHMARYFRLHLGSFLAIEVAKELAMEPASSSSQFDHANRFESVIELYEAGCADYMFNFVLDSNKREERLVTPILMKFDDNKNSGVLRKRRNVLGIHVFGDEKIRLWKRWGDPYDTLMDMNGNRSDKITMEITPFSNAVAIT